MKQVQLLTSIIACLTSSLMLFGQEQTLSCWHKLSNDTLQGINLDNSFKYLEMRNLRPQKQIIIGIIDSGIDTTSVDLQPSLWLNPKEIIDGKDNDKNGYVDDLHGWNFLGTKDKSFNMTSAGSEEYREFKRLYPTYKNADLNTLKDTTEYSYYADMKKKASIASYIQMFEYVSSKDKAYETIDSILHNQSAINIDTLTVKGLVTLPIQDKQWENACELIFVDLYKGGNDALWTKVKSTHKYQFDLMRSRLEGIEKDADKRLLMGDDMKNAKDRFYGNSTLQVDGCEHGTLVAGIIAGQGIVDKSITGIYPQAKVMIIRAVPDGDEYDKDIASSIRYAVDNGAKIINMSLGKYTSPDARMVNDAIAYAAKKDVLIIQAAGNNKRNIDAVPYFPSAKDKKGKAYSNYMRVGATGKLGKASSFSNYGKKEVAVFAPGEDITGPTIGNTYTHVQGTSVATPIVSAVAAIIRAYFPKLTAAQVKDILIQSVRPMDEKGLSASDGIIDAYQAVKLAAKYKQ